MTEGLSIADQQIIEIAKAISLDARVLIMDEPTAALSGVEVERLFAVARSLRDEGRALLFISHRFDEVFALCDTVTVMRDGSYIDTTPIAETTVDDLVRQMVGRDVTEMFPKLPAEVGDVVLEVEGLTRTGVFRDISFTSARARSSGSRASSAPGAARWRAPCSASTRTRAAASAWTAGRCPRATRARRPPGASRSCLKTAASRVSSSTTASRATSRSPSARSSRSGGSCGARSRTRPRRMWASKLEVKTAALDAEAGTLSGGNQQKVVLGKWLATEPKVLIVDEPTRGIDVGTKAEVHRLLSQLAQQGMAILMISSELPEVLGMADRVLVMREGRLTGEFPRAEATPEAVMYAATAEAEVRDDRDRRRPPGAAGLERGIQDRPQCRDRARDRHPDRPPRSSSCSRPSATPRSCSPPTDSATCC